MRGHVRRRGKSGSFEYIVDIGPAAAQRCTVCNRRFWIERRSLESCPKCGGTLKETEERRRETKAGFATQRECQAAMNKLLVSVEAHNYTAPSKATVRAYLTKEWLPAVKATIRPSTYNTYVQHVECHIAPTHRLGEARQALTGDHRSTPSTRKLAESRCQGGTARPLRHDDPSRP